jgi:hypothetical protein
MKTFKGTDKLPVLSSAIVDKIRKTMFPADFLKVMQALKKLSLGIYHLEETQQV